MNRKIASIITAGFIVFSFTVGAFAAGTAKEIKASLREDATYSVDGAAKSYKDKDGNILYPIEYNGTIYIPAGVIGSATGKSVAWDSKTGKVGISQGTESSSAPSTNSTGETMGQKNALAKAKQYLGYSAFSYESLVEQLEYEKFSHEDAVYGADHCGANWNEQAAKKAKQYLGYSSFSREGLIEQLEYEGFTHEQAVYGAEKNGY